MLALFARSSLPRPQLPFGFISRCIGSKSTRNKTQKWIGSHKEPLCEEQRLRRRHKHRPFVLGRDNVKRDFSPTPIPAESLVELKGSLPFEVKRTQFGHLPVYTEYRNGRGRILTLVRRIEGDGGALAEKVKAFLPSSDVSLNATTGHLVVNGNHQRTLRYYLTALGF